MGSGEPGRPGLTVRLGRWWWVVLCGLGGATVAAAWAGSVWSVMLVCWSAALVVLGLVDLRALVLPSRLVYLGVGVTVVGLAAGGIAGGGWGRLAQGVVCAVAAETVFGGWWLVAPRGIGLGDVRLVGLVALGVGSVSPEAVVLVLAGSCLGCALVGAGLAVGRRRGWGATVPMGPFLAAAGMVSAVAGGLLR